MAFPQSDNFYARLGLPFDATPAEIRRAYHAAAKRLHPDANASTEATDQFISIQEAYDTLTEPGLRTAYDRALGVIPAATGIDHDLQLSRRTLFPTDEPQLFYAMLTLRPAAAAPAEPPALNLCLVIDRSTSMQGRRMDAVKTTTRHLLQQLRPADLVSVVAFSDRAELVIEPTRERDLKKMDARISLIQTGGGTELFHGLQAGLKQIFRHQRSASIHHIILITDGHTYGDEDKCLALAEQAKENGVAISALGIGADWHEEFLEGLAAKTGGSTMYASRVQEIRPFLEKQFNQFQRTYADHIRLEFENTHPDVELRYAFRVRPDPTRLETGTAISVGRMPVDQSVEVILEFLVHKVRPDLFLGDLLQLAVWAEIPGRQVPSVRFLLDLHLPAGGDPASDPPRRLMEALERLTLYRMQEQARADMQAGDSVSAARRLRLMASQLLSSGENALAVSVLREVGRLEQGDLATKSLEKSILYGTRALIARSDP